MNIDWKLFITALGLAFVLEGLMYFLFAERMPRILALLSERKPGSIRLMGLSAVAVGLLVIMLVRP
jgi:uncharacterized protein YjeT (DUF2065 family)